MGKGLRLTPEPARRPDGKTSEEARRAAPTAADKPDEAVPKPPEQGASAPARKPVESVPDEPQPVPSDAAEEPVESVPDEPEPGAPDPPREAEAKAARARVRCPLCDGYGGETPAGTDHGYVRCEGCGTRFVKERPSLGQVARSRDALFKRAFALPNREERRTARERALEAMRGYFLIKRAKPAAFNAFGKDVLEVNCGLGFRLRAFQSYGWMVAGTETSATAFEYARRQSLDVRHGWLEEGRFGKTRFDLALLCASFGELADPNRAAEKLHGFLKPDGLVCVLGEPLASEDVEPPAEGSRLFVCTADALKRVFCENRFSFVSEEIGNATGTFWFQAKSLR